MSTIEQATIILVEDNEGHARLIEMNLRNANITNPLLKFKDGQPLLDYLFDDDGYVNNRLNDPLLILLDLNLPLVDGYRVLEKIKSDERTKHIPVIVMTTTGEPDEIHRCYALGCNFYIEKPVDYDQFIKAIKKLGQFLTILMFPNEK